MKFRPQITSPYLLTTIIIGILGVGWILHRQANFSRHEAAQSEKLNSFPAADKPVSLSLEEQRGVFEDFSAWTHEFTNAAADDRTVLAESGLKLALKRRALMDHLIKTDPKRALEQAVTLDVWHSLPSELQREVEEPFSALADFKVYPVCGSSAPNETRSTASAQLPDAARLTVIEKQPALDSYVFGRRKGLLTKEDSPVQGIRLGQSAALREGVFYVLSAAETSVATAHYPLANPSADRDFGTGELLGNAPVSALAGGKMFVFGGQESFENFESSIAKLDESPGPYSGATVLFLPYLSDENGGFNLKGAIFQSNLAASAWTETKKKLFMIRCDFSDRPNSSSPVVDANVYNSMLNTSVSNHVRDFSYGKTWIEATTSSSVTRLPKTAAYYNTKDAQGSTRNPELLSDAKAAFQTANPSFVPSNFDIIGIWFVDIGMSQFNFKFSGLAGGPDLWIQGTSDIAIHVHELGHNYGLGHSSFWTLPGGSINPVDPSGTNDEYGDGFDVMGKGTVPEGAFHVEAKQRLNWLSAGEWADIKAGTSGTYRINRIDHPSTRGVRGLRVPKGSDDFYWLSYRRLFPNSWLKAGANIAWQQSAQGRSWLIDTTPGSASGDSDREDGALTIGRTYSDGNFHITTLARGGISPNEYLDIRVNSGSFPGNAAPTVTLNGPSSINARQTCFLTAQASDANGDELAYSWDFGQGFSFDNNPTATFAWNVGGTFTVKVTVSDMKGKTAQATKTITVTDPLTTWTARENNAVGDFKALVASPSRVLAIGELRTTGSDFRGPFARSTDGVTWTNVRPPGNVQGFAGAWDGSQFVIAGSDIVSSTWTGCIFTSPTANTTAENGGVTSWTRRYIAGPELRGISFGNGIYVAVGENGTIITSLDTLTWTPRTSGTTNRLSSIAFGNGRFVAVGHLNTLAVATGTPIVLTSPDGITWTNTTAGAGVESWQDLRSIVWASDRFLASGWYGKLRHSTDLGTSFITNRTSTEDTPALAFGNGAWFAAGVNKYNADADIDLVSADGSNWTPLTTPSLDNRNAAIFFNNTFITAGNNKSIRQSGTLAPSGGGYFLWRENNFPNRESLSSPEKDADGDGISNLLEFALGSSPLSGSAGTGSALPQALISAPEPLLNDRLALQLSIPDPTSSEFTYVVEAASSLGSSWTPLATKVGSGAWAWNPGGTSRIVVGAPANGKVLVKVGDSVARSASTRRFLRLKTYPNP